MSEEILNEIKKSATETAEAVRVLREETEKGVEGNAEAIKKANDFLDKMEEKNQAFAQSLESEKAASAELKETVENLEKKLLRMNKSELEGEKGESYQLGLKIMIEGEKGLTADEIKKADEFKLLRTDSDPDGGVLVHPEISAEILKNITEISPMRSIARVMSTSSKSVEIPKRTGLISGGWVGERETAPQDSSTYGMLEIPVNKLMVDAEATIEMIQDSAMNVAGEITADVAEDFAQIEGAAFVNGDGVKKPKGFLQDATIQEVNTGDAGAITSDSIIQIAGELKTGYSPVYVMNRKTVAAVRLLKDLDEQYLWQPGLATGNPNTLNGAPYVEMPDMPDVAADAFPIAYGDFFRGYRIVDHSATSVIRDDLTKARQAIVAWIFMRRVGGQVVLPEAIKKLKVAV
jgi:HK97 family phage major capsid protein